MATNFENRNMNNLYDYMKDEGRNGKNSAEFDEVFQALKLFNTYQDQPINRDSKMDIVKAHGHLVEACEKYIEKKKGAWTSKGKERLDWVNAIKNLASQENYADYDLSKMPEGAKWGDVTADLRTMKIDITGREIGHAGSGASDRLVIEEGFFTRDDKVCSDKQKAFDEVKKQYPERFAQILEDNREYLVLKSTDTPETIKKREQSYLEDISQKVADKEDQKAVLDVLKRLSGISNTATVAKGNGIAEGQNMSNRNVASSRLAEMIGISSSLALSKKATLVNNGVEISGIIMDKAVGYDVHGKNNDLEKLEPFKGVRGIDGPEAFRRITDIHIMDMISGQCDRHSANVFYDIQTDENGQKYVKSVQGIDNDLAFSTYLLDTDKERAELEKQGKNFFPSSGAIDTKKLGYLSNIKYVDEKTYSNIMSIDKEQLKYMFSDVLEPKYIDALSQRLDMVQKHISSEAVVKVTDWSELTAEKMKEDRYFSMYNSRIESIRDDFIKQAEKEAQEKPGAVKEEAQAKEAESKAPTVEEKQGLAEEKQETKRKSAAPKERLTFAELSKEGGLSHTHARKMDVLAKRREKSLSARESAEKKGQDKGMNPGGMGK